MAKLEEIQVGACLRGIHDTNKHREPWVIRAEPNDTFLTYDGENDVFQKYTLQELVMDFSCMDNIPDDAEDFAARFDEQGK